MTYYTLFYEVPCTATISFEDKENLTKEEVVARLKEKDFSSLDIDIDNSYGDGFADFCSTLECEFVEDDERTERLY